MKMSAALGAGALNALAGGGSFLTLPALFQAGLPPIAANDDGLTGGGPTKAAVILPYERHGRPAATGPDAATRAAEARLGLHRGAGGHLPALRSCAPARRFRRNVHGRSQLRVVHVGTVDVAGCTLCVGCLRE